MNSAGDLVLLGSIIMLVAACEQSPAELSGRTAAPQSVTPMQLVAADHPGITASADPGVDAFALSTTVVDMTRAPGTDGLQGTADDVLFDLSFTPRYQRTSTTGAVNFASPSGQEWSALGVTFAYISGAEALTIGANGCLGSQLPDPAVINNWDGGVRVQFVGPGGVPATVSRISVEVTTRSRLDAYDAAGNLLGSQTAPNTALSFLAVTAPGIARVELNGDFWCIARSVQFDDLTYVPASVIAQIGVLVSQGEVDPGVGNSLQQMLTNAQAAFARGNSQAALNMIKAFMNHVSAQTGVHITASAAALLQTWAQAIAASYQP